MKKKVKNPGKKLDRLANELGTTIKGMTAEQKRRYARKDTTKKLTGITGANVINLATVGRQFLEMVDGLDFDTLPAKTPALVKMLQQYDRLLGLPPSPDSSCGIDVRIIFNARKRFLPMNPKK